MVLMFAAYQFSQNPALLGPHAGEFKFAAPIFAFGLVAFGFLGMGPVTIAVDSYGPVTDNAQSVYELSQIEGIKYQPPKSRRTSASRRISKRQVSAGKGRRRRQHVQGHRQARPDRHRRRRRHDDGVRHHHAAGKSYSADVVEQFEPGAARDHAWPAHGRRGDLLVHRCFQQAVVTGAYRAVVYIKDHMTWTTRPPRKGQQGSGPHLHRLCAKGHVEHLHRHLLLRAGAARFSTRISSSAT